MATSTKKPASSSTKLASSKPSASSSSKPSTVALAAVEKTRHSAESMVKIGTDTIKELFSNSTSEAQKTHDKLFAVTRESAENFSRAVENSSRFLNEMVAISRDNADAIVEVSNIASDIAKSIHEECVNSINENFADNIEITKEAFGCRNITDFIEIQNKWTSTNLDNFFSQSSRLVEMVFQLATEAAEPINERVADATERFSKSLAA